MFIYFVPSFSLYSYSKLISFWGKRCNAEGSEIIENKEVCGGVWVLKLRKEVEVRCCLGAKRWARNASASFRTLPISNTAHLARPLLATPFAGESGAVR